jgi:TRAP-type C4-dicarboxylate transport system permease small subunit
MIRTALTRLDRALALGCRWIVIGCFVGLFLLLWLGILQRTFPSIKLSGYDELIELLFVWMTFIGSVALWREGSLYRVDVLERLLSGRARQVLAVIVHLTMLATVGMLTFEGLGFALHSGETTPFLQADKIYWYAAIPVSGALMSLYSGAALWRTFRGEAITAGEISLLS